MYCLAKKRVEWAFRIWYQTQKSKSSWFITLTYNQDDVPVFVPSMNKIIRGKFARNLSVRRHKVNTVYRPDYLKYIRDLRRLEPENTEIQYFGVSEYGGETQRPHYHFVVWNVKNPENIKKAWDRGWCTMSPMKVSRAMYLTKYTYNQDEYTPPLAVKTWRSMSRGNTQGKKKGIGVQYVDDFKAYHKSTLTDWGKLDQTNVTLPKYFKDQIFTDEEKIDISLNKMGEQRKEFVKEYKRLKAKGVKDPEKLMLENKIRTHQVLLEKQKKSFQNENSM